jgi:uncharacterized protein (DUF2235 family)
MAVRLIWQLASSKRFQEMRCTYISWASGQRQCCYMSNPLNFQFRDTVSSVGVIRSKNLPLTNQCEHICYIRHALALDERRVKFLPEYMCGGESYRDEDISSPPLSMKFPPSEDNGDRIQSLRNPAPEKVHRPPRVKEVWFPGSHSDV